MTTLPDEIKDALYRFLNGRTPPAEFERWVYATSALEDVFDRDSYIPPLTLLDTTAASAEETARQIRAWIGDRWPAAI